MPHCPHGSYWLIPESGKIPTQHQITWLSESACPGKGYPDLDFTSNHSGLPWWLRGLSVCLQCGRPGFDPWVGKIPWRRQWQPTPVLLPGKSYGLRSLVGYSPWGCKELDMTEQLHFHFLITLPPSFLLQLSLKKLTLCITFSMNIS